MSALPAPPPGFEYHVPNGAAIPANPLATVSDSILDANPMSHPVWDIETFSFVPPSFDVACIDPAVFEDRAMSLFQKFCLEKHVVQLVFPVAQEQFDKLHQKLQMLLILVVRSIHLRDGLASPRSDRGFDEAKSGRATRSYDDALYSVFVGGLAFDVDIDELSLVFNCFGTVIDAQLCDKKDCAFISFDSPVSVQTAISRMQGFAYFVSNLRPAYGKPIRALARTYVLSEGRINAMNAAINKRSASSILTLINGEFNGNLSNFSNALRVLARNETQAMPAAPYKVYGSAGSGFAPWYEGNNWNGTVYYHHGFNPSRMAPQPPFGQWHDYNTHEQKHHEAAQLPVNEAQPVVPATPSNSSAGAASHHEVDPESTGGSFGTPSSTGNDVSEPAGVTIPVTEMVALWASNVVARQAGHPTRSQNEVSGTSTASRGPALWTTPVLPLSRTKSQEVEKPRGLDNTLADASVHGRLQSLPTNWLALDKNSIWAPI